jgi:hypothetical protein
MSRTPPPPKVETMVTTKAGAAGAMLPTRVVVVAGRTFNSADVIAFRDALEKGGILTFVEELASLSPTRRWATSRGASLFRPGQSIRVGFTARTRDLYDGFLRGGGFARSLVRGALRPGVLAATSGAAAMGVRL